MLAVYIAGPYAGGTHLIRERHILEARELGARVALLGVLPVIPHSNSAHFGDVMPAEFWYRAGIELLSRCDALIATNPYTTSVVTRREIDFAKSHDIACFDGVGAFDGLRMWVEVQSRKGGTLWELPPVKGRFK